MTVKIIFDAKGKTLEEIMKEDFLEFIETYIRTMTK